MPDRIAPLRITAYTATTAAGAGRSALLQVLQEGRSALRPNDFGAQPLPTHIGRVDGLEQAALPPAWRDWDCRNNRLAWLGLQQDGFLAAVAEARERLGAHRVALVLGTSTSSIGATEEAYTRLDADGRFPADTRLPRLHTPHSLGLFVQQALGLSGPCYTVSTACSSSAKVFADAQRLIALGLADAAVVGGVDTLCGSVLFGFNALELVSPEPCRPFDVERRGISLGEAAGFALLEPEDGRTPGPRLEGYGEASDAHHMSTPHPEGLGAERALDDALARAGLPDTAIDAINLHGTASSKNDEVEGALVARRFGPQVHASSTKGVVGHTLGAAGIVEAVICLLSLESGFLPGNTGCVTPDPVCGPQLRLQGQQRRPEDLQHLLSNSFGFGGNNCALIFGRGPQPGWTPPVADGATATSAAAQGLACWVDGIGFWAPSLPGWPVARAALAGPGQPADPPARKPQPQMLAAAERRRAPDTVALALEVAAEACAAAHADPASLPSAFVSAHGDLAINDYMCSTLATTPTMLSPTKFHNSVHNAAAGYWTMAAHCHQASTALTAFDASFANGLLAAAVQCVADQRPVLLVGYDIAATGALASVTRSEGLLAMALVLSPQAGPHSLARLQARTEPRAGDAAAPALRPAAQALAGNALADALPLAQALAGIDAAAPTVLAMALGQGPQLQLNVAPA